MTRASSNQLKVVFGGHTTAGLKPVNQDAFAALAGNKSANMFKGAVAVIADGVSSSTRSEVASQLAVTHFISDYFSTPDTWSVRESASRVLHAMNSWLYHNGGPHLNIESLVTTLSCVIVKSRTAHIFHIGDSRIYLLRTGVLEQLTTDHFASVAGNRTVLTRALGLDTRLQVDHTTVQVRQGDVFMLTTDGVHDYLQRGEMESLVNDDTTNLERSGERIANHALRNGSDDNLSCLFLKVHTLPEDNYNEMQAHPQAIPPVMSEGNSIDGYRVSQVLHTSPRSHLYLVESPEDAKKLVLKTPSQNFDEDPQYLQGFVREQWVGLRVNHLNVMKVVARPHDTNFMYNLFEYLPHGDLSQWMLDNDHPSLETTRRLAEQITGALRAFQRLSMVHRDLKPENVMVDDDLNIKLIDFGTVQVAGLDELASHIAEEYPVGSTSYMAPEYLLDQPGMYRSDIFSLGVLIYEMLSGELPYKVPTHKLNGKPHFGDWRYRSILQFRPDLPLWVDLCLQKATAPSPNDRYQALSEFMQDLRKPNQDMLNKRAKAPLLERNPLLFWQAMSALLFGALLLSLWADS